MTEKLDMVRQNNAACGHPKNEINIAMDSRYNSSTFSSRKKPRQNVSQCISLAVEQNTDKQYVVAEAVQNKLCWTGAWLKHKGFAVTCPDGHADCTANYPISIARQKTYSVLSLCKEYIILEVNRP